MEKPLEERFRSADVRKLLHNKFVIVIGGSVQRGFYKDLVAFLQRDDLLLSSDLKVKGEKKFKSDVLCEGGQLGEMTNQTHYREIRQYQSEYFLVRFYFITRVYSPYFETIVEDLQHESSPKPDIIIMNSCLWDMSRYGPKWLEVYKINLDLMLNALKSVVSDDSLFIWITCMPVGQKARGGFLVKNAQFKRETLRLDVLEANFVASQAVRHHGFDVVDLNFYFRALLHLRVKDEIHWAPLAHRKMTSLVLLHICDAWGVPRPRPMMRIEPDPVETQLPAWNRNERGDFRRRGDAPWNGPQRPTPYNRQGRFPPMGQGDLDQRMLERQRMGRRPMDSFGFRPIQPWEEQMNFNRFSPEMQMRNFTREMSMRCSPDFGFRQSSQDFMSRYNPDCHRDSPDGGFRNTQMGRSTSPYFDGNFGLNFGGNGDFCNRNFMRNDNFAMNRNFGGLNNFDANRGFGNNRNFQGNDNFGLNRNFRVNDFRDNRNLIANENFGNRYSRGNDNFRGNFGSSNNGRFGFDDQYFAMDDSEMMHSHSASTDRNFFNFDQQQSVEDDLCEEFEKLNWPWNEKAPVSAAKALKVVVYEIAVSYREQVGQSSVRVESKPDAKSAAATVTKTESKTPVPKTESKTPVSKTESKTPVAKTESKTQVSKIGKTAMIETSTPVKATKSGTSEVESDDGVPMYDNYDIEIKPATTISDADAADLDKLKFAFQSHKQKSYKSAFTSCKQKLEERKSSTPTAKATETSRSDNEPSETEKGIEDEKIPENAEKQCKVIPSSTVRKNDGESTEIRQETEKSANSQESKGEHNSSQSDVMNDTVTALEMALANQFMSDNDSQNLDDNEESEKILQSIRELSAQFNKTETEAKNEELRCAIQDKLPQGSEHSENSQEGIQEASKIEIHQGSIESIREESKDYTESVSKKACLSVEAETSVPHSAIGTKTDHWAPRNSAGSLSAGLAGESELEDEVFLNTTSSTETTTGAASSDRDLLNSVENLLSDRPSSVVGPTNSAVESSGTLSTDDLLSALAKLVGTPDKRGKPSVEMDIESKHETEVTKSANPSGSDLLTIDADLTIIAGDEDIEMADVPMPEKTLEEEIMEFLSSDDADYDKSVVNDSEADESILDLEKAIDETETCLESMRTSFLETDISCIEPSNPVSEIETLSKDSFGKSVLTESLLPVEEIQPITSLSKSQPIKSQPTTALQPITSAPAESNNGAKNLNSGLKIPVIDSGPSPQSLSSGPTSPGLPDLKVKAVASELKSTAPATLTNTSRYSTTPCVVSSTLASSALSNPQTSKSDSNIPARRPLLSLPKSIPVIAPDNEKLSNAPGKMRRSRNRMRRRAQAPVCQTSVPHNRPLSASQRLVSSRTATPLIQTFQPGPYHQYEPQIPQQYGAPRPLLELPYQPLMRPQPISPWQLSNPTYPPQQGDRYYPHNQPQGRPPWM